jgi:superfamily II DNA helicase RecQ
MEALEHEISERFHLKLHHWQAHAIDTLIGGNDVVITAGTGSGKSLVFQALALARPGAIVLVLAPINGLMENQVSHLRLNEEPDITRFSSFLASSSRSLP